MVLNIYELRKFKKHERKLFLNLYDQLLIRIQETAIGNRHSLTEYRTLSAYNLLTTEEELIAYKRDDTIDEILEKN